MLITSRALFILLGVPLHLFVPESEFEAECHRFSVDAVAPADARRLLVSQGLFLRTVIRSFMSLMMMFDASLIKRARAVSTTSDDVSPLWMDLDSGPTFSATAVGTR